jgi:hypothetical protein
MARNEGEDIIGEGTGLHGEWWVLGARWNCPDLYTIVHIIDADKRPKWGAGGGMPTPPTESQTR